MPQVEYLTVAEALSKVLAAVSVLPAETVSLSDSLGRILAEPVVAQDNLPPFANSSMDGYAFQAADVAGAAAESPAILRVIGEVAAGSVFEGSVSQGTAVRIMTGAPLPHGADAVIPVEETDEAWRNAERPLPEKVAIKRSVRPGDYVRQPGEDVFAGQTVLAAGHYIRPQEIGVIASLGVSQLQVVRRPRVGILATGDELIDIDQPLIPGKIRNSNGYTQGAQITAAGGIPISLGIGRDTEADVRTKLQRGLDEKVDLFISSAGVSVGVYDVVTAVLEQQGAVNFWRVRMRPGKPLAFGTYGATPYFGLPGNPVSAMVSFERFARPALRKMGGWQKLDRPQRIVTLQDEIKSDGRESYIRAVVERTAAGYTAKTTGSQGSHIMTSLVKANALLIIPEGVEYVPIGAELIALMLDWPEFVF